MASAAGGESKSGNRAAGGESKSGNNDASIGQEAIQRQLTCPITMELMRFPVQGNDGFFYEESALRKHLDKSSTSPITRKRMWRSDVKPSRKKLKEVMDFVKKYPKHELSKNWKHNIESPPTGERESHPSLWFLNANDGRVDGEEWSGWDSNNHMKAANTHKRDEEMNRQYGVWNANTRRGELARNHARHRRGKRGMSEKNNKFTSNLGAANSNAHLVSAKSHGVAGTRLIGKLARDIQKARRNQADARGPEPLQRMPGRYYVHQGLGHKYTGVWGDIKDPMQSVASNIRTMGRARERARHAAIPEMISDFRLGSQRLPFHIRGHIGNFAGKSTAAVNSQVNKRNTKGQKRRFSGGRKRRRTKYKHKKTRHRGGRRRRTRRKKC